MDNWDFDGFTLVKCYTGNESYQPSWSAEHKCAVSRAARTRILKDYDEDRFGYAGWWLFVKRFDFEHAAYSLYATKSIFYCPFCGKRLDELNESEPKEESHEGRYDLRGGGKDGL